MAEELTSDAEIRQRADLIDRLNAEADHCATANSYGRDILAPLMRCAVEEMALLAERTAERDKWKRRARRFKQGRIDEIADAVMQRLRRAVAEAECTRLRAERREIAEEMRELVRDATGNISKVTVAVFADRLDPPSSLGEDKFMNARVDRPKVMRERPATASSDVGECPTGKA